MRIAVIYYSSTGTIHAMATALAEGAEEEGAEIRLRRVPELAPDAAIDANPAWRKYVDEVAPKVEVAQPADLEWADAYALGTPTRYGLPAAQMKQFIDTTGGIWQAGKLQDKAATSFASAINVHGGAESTILALNNVLYHWGAIIVAPGYTDPQVYAGGGNPYGASHSTGMPPQGPSEGALTVAKYQGRRLAQVAKRLQGGAG